MSTVILAENMNLQKMIHAYFDIFELPNRIPIIFCNN